MQNLSFDATLEYIAPKATENNGTNKFEIKAAILPQKDHKIRSGYSANAEITLEQASKVLAVPESALEFSGDSTFVYVKRNGNFTRQAVNTGLSDGINIQITSGLKEGEIVRGSQIIEKE